MKEYLPRSMLTNLALPPFERTFSTQGYKYDMFGLILHKGAENTAFHSFDITPSPLEIWKFSLMLDFTGGRRGCSKTETTQNQLFF